jgi:hypothetical protein
MKKKQPFETDAHMLTGKSAMDLYRKEDLNSLAMKLVPNYNPDRFDASALRFFVQKGEPVITLFAVDKVKQEGDHYPSDRLPVRKFKIRMSFDEFISHFKRFDVTLTNDAYDIGDMLVMNK